MSAIDDQQVSSPTPVDWAPSAGRFVDVDAQTLRSHFDRKPFLFPHCISAHPVFSLPRLVALARSLRAEFVEYNSGTIPISLPDWLDTPYSGLSVEDSLRQLAEVCSWISLKRAEADSDYKEVLDRCLDEIEAVVADAAPGLCERAACIFVSSPESITPYHMDHEINFLLQIRGTKTVFVFDGEDRGVVPHRQLEDYFAGDQLHRNLPFGPELQKHAIGFELKEGYGLHIPSTFPHWVQNGSEISISISVSLSSAASLRRARVYRMNAMLRKMIGVDPVPYGESAIIDTAKHQAFRVLHRVSRWLSLAGLHPEAGAQ